jgi:hypothetical protein
MTWRWWYFLLVPFTALNVLASLLLAMPYGVRAWRWRAGCLELVAKRRNDQTRIWGRPAAQSLGCQVIWYASERHWDDPGLRVHERCHAIQGILGLGLPFGAAYGLHFLWEWARIGFGPWHSAYMRIWAERQAYRIQDEFEAGQRPGAWGE